MGFSRQEYWSGLPLPSPGDLHDPGIKPRSPALQADALTSEPPGKPLKCLSKDEWICIHTNTLTDIHKARTLEGVAISFSNSISCITYNGKEYEKECIVVLMVKNPPANAGDIRDAGLIPGSGRSPGGGHGNPLQYSCLENPMIEESGRLQVIKSRTRLKQLSTHIWVSPV